MSSLIAVIILFTALFVASYVTRRRFGMLGLALAAGSLLSSTWADSLTPFLERQGVVLVVPPLASAVQILLILAPPLSLLLSGSVYNKALPRILGSLTFALLAVTLLVKILAAVLVIDGPSVQIFQILQQYQNPIIIVCVIAALADVIFTRVQKSRGGKKATH